MDHARNGSTLTPEQEARTQLEVEGVAKLEELHAVAQLAAARRRPLRQLAIRQRMNEQADYLGVAHDR